MMAIDFEVWAPLGADERLTELWHATPDANPLPDGVEPHEPVGAPAKERLGELAVPTLIVTASHDPAGMREIGPLVEREAPDARHLELDSDHYVTLREPELLAGVLLEFLAAAAPQQ
jgi:pimeloyl-ACP methyl ester carboxylesterase